MGSCFGTKAGVLRSIYFVSGSLGWQLSTSRHGPDFDRPLWFLDVNKLEMIILELDH